MDVMSSGDEYDDELMSKDMLEDICDDTKSRLSINRREACYKIRGFFLNKVNQNGKECYYQRETWVNFYTNYLRLLLIIFHKH